MIKEHPILFSTEMVKAIIEGRKTMTRRIVKFPVDYDGKDVYNNYPFGLKYSSSQFEGCVRRLFPKWQKGDLLWVRESWNVEQYPVAPEGDHDERLYYYRATEKKYTDMKWRPSIFMPKEAARIWLEVIGVKVERLQDITEQDAKVEGVIPLTLSEGGFVKANGLDYQGAFRLLWEKINGEESWYENPWVWVIEFKVLSTTGKPKFKKLSNVETI